MAGWTTPATWAASEVPTSTKMNAQIRDNLNALNGFAVKTSAETVSASTALQNDDQLALAIPATGTYLIEAILFVASSINAGGDFKVGATWPTATVHQFGMGTDPGLASGSVQTGEWKINASATSGSSVISYGASTTNTAVFARWIVIASATGTFQMQWAQVSASGTTTLQIGSHMTMRQVA